MNIWGIRANYTAVRDATAAARSQPAVVAPEQPPTAVAVPEQPHAAATTRSHWLPPFARSTLSALGLGSASTSGGPTRPDASGARQRRRFVSGESMSLARVDAVARQANAALHALRPVSRVAPGLATTPTTHDGMRDEAGFRQAVQAMFTDASVTDELIARPFARVDPSDDESAPFIAPLVLATALKSMGTASLAEAEGLVQTAEAGIESVELFRLERILAATVPGTEALGHMRHLHGEPDQLSAHRDGLAICTALARQGFNIDAYRSVQEVANALRDVPDVRLHFAIGTADDTPLQLLAQALTHTQLRARPQGPAADALASTIERRHNAAFVAWKKGAFVESGPRTDFNRAIERLHKFSTYVDRADHGPRSLANLAHDAYSLFGRMVGVGKSPLTPMRGGTQGGDLGLLHEESAKFKQSLRDALGAAVEHLTDELEDAEVQRSPAKVYPRLARLAAFDLWREADQPRLAIGDVVARAKKLLVDAGGNANWVHEPTLLKHLRSFTSRSRTESGVPMVRIGLSALQTVSAARAAVPDQPPAADFNPRRVREEVRGLRNLQERNPEQRARLLELQGQRRDRIATLVADTRSIKNAGVHHIPLFKLSDLRGLFGYAPREGPTPADAHRVMDALASAKFESQATFADGASKGFGSVGAFPLNIGAALGVPLVYPVLRAETGKRATVAVGVGSTGGRLFVGTEKSISGAVGVGAGWVAPTPAQILSAAFLGELSVSHAASRGEGVVVTTRNDLPGWQEKLPHVIDFLFDQARLPPGEGEGTRAADASETWGRFAEAFGDDPHVAVGWSREKSSGTVGGIGLTGVARFPVGSEMSVGPGLALSLQMRTGGFQRTPGTDGVDVPVAVRSSRVVASVSGSVTATAPGFSTNFAAVPAWGFAVPLLGATREWNIAGGLGVVRLGRTREGQLSPGLCQREFIFESPERLIELVNLHRQGWELAMVEKDPARRTTPAAAHARLNTFLEQVATLPRGGECLHAQAMTLAPSVTCLINNFEARRATILGVGDHRAEERVLSPTESVECAAIENEVERLLTNDGSWQYNALFSVEINQVGSTNGLDLGIKVSNQETAASGRLTALLIASQPEV